MSLALLSWSVPQFQNRSVNRGESWRPCCLYNNVFLSGQNSPLRTLMRCKCPRGSRFGQKRREMRWSVGLLCLCVIHLQVNSIFKAKPYSRGCWQTGFPGSRFSLCLLVRTTKVVHMTSKLPLQTDKQREREREREQEKKVAVAFTAHRALNESYLEMVWTQRSLSEEKKK